MAEEKATVKNKPKKSKIAKEGDKKCSVQKCKQTARAKGYCRKHYMSWRRGELGKKQRYNSCSKEGCRKPVVAGGRCAEHKKGAETAAAS